MQSASCSSDKHLASLWLQPGWHWLRNSSTLQFICTEALGTEAFVFLSKGNTKEKLEWIWKEKKNQNITVFRLQHIQALILIQSSLNPNPSTLRKGWEVRKMLSALTVGLDLFPERGHVLTASPPFSPTWQKPPCYTVWMFLDFTITQLFVSCRLIIPVPCLGTVASLAENGILLRTAISLHF